MRGHRCRPRTRDRRVRLFLNREGTECFVHERFRDSAAGLEHMKNISEVMQRLSLITDMSGEVCGTPSLELREALESAGVTIYEPRGSQ